MVIASVLGAEGYGFESHILEKARFYHLKQNYITSIPFRFDVVKIVLCCK